MCNQKAKQQVQIEIIEPLRDADHDQLTKDRNPAQNHQSPQTDPVCTPLRGNRRLYGGFFSHEIVAAVASRPLAIKGFGLI